MRDFVRVQPRRRFRDGMTQGIALIGAVLEAVAAKFDRIRRRLSGIPS